MEAEQIQILYMDEQVIGCVKPAGILSQDGEASSLPELLRRQCGGEIYPVHRLDRETAGVMVFARTAQAAAKLSAAIQQDRMIKEYLAVVTGKPEQPEGILEDLLYYNRRAGKVYVVDRKRNGVKSAKLAYRTLAEREDSTLAQVRLYTGRTHQIRVQFASRKMPLLSDRRYGGKGGNGRPALWSARIRFPHPKTGRLCEIMCLPEQLGQFDTIPGLTEMD